MVEATLRAALAIEYPHRTTVLNDGLIAGVDDWHEIEALCRRYGVGCLTRTDGLRGKAGNLNAALAATGGEFIVVIDADHLARPELGEMLLGYFSDPAVAFVTSRQCFRLDSGDVLGHQEALFYSAIQPAKDRDNAAFSCGNGVAYRRSALADVGGFSEWNLVEDLHTSYELHARGWLSAYVGLPVTIGTAPNTAAEMASQRLRWATDSLRMFFWDNPLRRRRLSLRQRLHYLHTTGWYLVAAAHVVFLFSPIASILLGVRLLAPGTESTYALLLALYLTPVAVMLTAHVGWRAALRTAQIQTFLAPVFALAVVRALRAAPRRRAHALQSGVTRKARPRQTSWITVFQHVVLALLLVSIGVAISRPGESSWAVVLWACVLATALASPGSMLGLQRDATQSLRIAITAPAVGAAILVALTVGTGSPVTASSVALAGVGPSSTRQAAPAKAGPPLAPPARGVYLGVYNRSVAGPPSAPLSLDRYPGARLRIVHRFQQWWGSDRFLGPEWLDAVAAAGAVPMVSWEPWQLPRDSVAAPSQRPGILRQIANGRYDVYVRRWANDARAYGKPLLLRFMHEMNGTWYPWAARVNGNTPASFKAAWRHVHDIFRQAGARNVSWVFSIVSFGGGTPTARHQLDRYYPGPRYVDWLGLSGFNWSRKSNGGVLSFDRVFRRAYDIVTGYGKPIMLSELGSASVDTKVAPKFVRDALTTTPKLLPRVKALVWYDASHPKRDFTLRGAALTQFQRGARLTALRPALRTAR